MCFFIKNLNLIIISKQYKIEFDQSNRYFKEKMINFSKNGLLKEFNKEKKTFQNNTS